MPSRGITSDQQCAEGEQAVREAATICPAPCKLTFDLLTLTVVSESRDVGYLCANFNLPIGLSVLDLGRMYATDRRRQTYYIIA